MVDITFNGMTMEYSFVENKMDAEIKARLNSEMPSCSEQDLLDAYIQAHRAKYGKEFLQG